MSIQNFWGEGKRGHYGDIMGLNNNIGGGEGGEPEGYASNSLHADNALTSEPWMIFFSSFITILFTDT